MSPVLNRVSLISLNALLFLLPSENGCFNHLGFKKEGFFLLKNAEEQVKPEFRAWLFVKA